MSQDLSLTVDSHFASAWAMSVFVALTEKNLPFTIERLDLASGEHRRGAYAQASLSRRVPMLKHGDFALSESSAITEYLNEQFGGQSLYPADPRQRAQARQVQAWLRSDLSVLRQERDTRVLFLTPIKTPLSPDGREAADHLVAVADRLLSHGEEHLFGQWCIADVDLAAMLCRLALNGDTLPAHVSTYALRQWQRPCVQQWVEKPRDSWRAALGI